MPELPEVENTVTDLRAADLVGSRITDAEAFWPRTVGGNPQAFRESLIGRTISGIERRGKYILLRLEQGLVGLLHLRMSGRLVVQQSGTTEGAYDRARLVFESGLELRFHDPRKFGRFVLHEEQDAMRVLSRLGVDPLDYERFTAAELARVFAGRRRRIKPLLLDQTIVAGLGNIYADESLYDAGIHPTRPASSLRPPEIEALVNSVRTVLEQAIEAGGTSLGTGHGNLRLPSGRSSDGLNGLRVYGKNGKDCSRCGTRIARIRLAQRSTHFCPRCQPEARIKAVLLDMDGTMIETEQLYLSSLQRAAEEMGSSLAYGELVSTVGKTSEATRVMLRALLGEDFDFDSFAQRVEHIMRTRIEQDGVTLRPGLQEFLHELKSRGIPHGVATSTYRSEAEYVLKQLGLYDKFDVIVCGDDVSHGKPAPDIYLLASRLLGFEAADCLVVEDSDPGIRAAAAAEVAYAVLIPDLAQPTPRARRAASRICSSLSELTALLRSGVVRYE